MDSHERVILIPSDGNLSINQAGLQCRIPRRLPFASMRREFFALHLPNPERWEVSQTMIEAEIKKARKAKAEHSRERRKEKRVIGFQPS